MTILPLRDSQWEVGAETEAAARREANHLAGGGVDPPDGPARGHARVLWFGGKHVLGDCFCNFLRDLQVPASGRGHGSRVLLAVLARGWRKTRGGVRGGAHWVLKYKNTMYNG